MGVYYVVIGSFIGSIPCKPGKAVGPKDTGCKANTKEVKMTKGFASRHGSVGCLASQCD
jgi:hypothetical protein